VSQHVIRRIRLAHCARGPAWCEKCREMDREAISLLDIDPPNQGMVTRRVIQVEVDGETVWREYDLVRVFEGEAEAREYAVRKGVEDVQL